jgi:hypothetical protein
MMRKITGYLRMTTNPTNAQLIGRTIHTAGSRTIITILEAIKGFFDTVLKKAFLI